jgi:hypothetical protein
VIQSAAAGIAQSEGVDGDEPVAPPEAFGPPSPPAAPPSEVFFVSVEGVFAAPSAAAPSAGPPFAPASPLAATFVSEPDESALEELELGAGRRSFFAQPVPLKWIAGAVIPFRTGPLPHCGHVAGPSAWTPWMTSKRWPHALQT